MRRREREYAFIVTEFILGVFDFFNLSPISTSINNFVFLLFIFFYFLFLFFHKDSLVLNPYNLFTPYNYLSALLLI